MNTALGFRKTLLSLALAAVCGALALPGQAAIVTVGEVNPNPAGGTVIGRLSVGHAGSGSVTVNGGSVLTGDVIGLGEQATGHGALTVTGLGSRVALLPTGPAGNLDIGSQGTGSVSVLAGASFVTGVAQNGACANNCRLFVSNAAGSNGTVLVNGIGSSFTTPGQISVGNASVFTVATDGFNYGTPGGSSQGSFRVEAGATVSSWRLIVGNAGGGLGRNGHETSSGSVVVDGVGSVWNLVRQAGGNPNLLFMTSGQVDPAPNTTGTVSITNGGRMRLDGSAAPSSISGINMGLRGGTNSHATINVSGAGSRIELFGGVGFLNVGHGGGHTGRMTISQGGAVTGLGDSGLPFATIGRSGGTGELTVSGTDAAGTASLFRLNGADRSANPIGAFLQVGRFESGRSGTGAVHVTGGGRVEIDTSGLVLTNPNGQTGMYVGFGDGSSGTINIDGRSALTGAASMLSITAGSGLAPYIGVGRDGATGNLNLTGGGKMVVDSSHVSVPNAGGYLPGDAMFLEIGLRTSAAVGPAATTGVVTVSGAGSELAMTGSVDRLITVGSGSNATGSLNILAGGTVRSELVLIGASAGGSGALEMNNGRLILDGVRNGGPSAGTGGGLALGRGGAVGTASIGNGSEVTITSTAPRAFIALGGTNAAVGGVGTLAISGGSVVSVNSPEARINVGNVGTAAQLGIGTLSLSGAGSRLSAVGTDAKVQIGAFDNTIGTLVVGAGATLSSTSLIGVGHDGNVSAGGSGVLIVNGIANAASLQVGTNGLLGGAGTVNANVVNHGLINPGNSPGRLTLNGDFDNSDGKIVLEIKMLPNGSFIVDELVFGHGALVTMGAGRIEFSFLDNTDPRAFFASGDFSLDSFFKETDASGAVIDLQAGNLDWFSSTEFGARSDQFRFDSFHFDPVLGASFQATQIPLPSTLLLALAALWALASARRARARHA